MRMILVAICLGLMSVVHAEPPPSMCNTDTRFRAFDFWLGTWEVIDQTTGKLAGHNSITKAEHGCVLMESWTSASGNSTGMSMNWYNQQTGRWTQSWVSGQDYSILISGNPVGPGTMLLEGTIYEYGSGSAPFKGTWTRNPDGTVRQFFERQGPDGKWAPWFDGLYKPKK